MLKTFNLSLCPTFLFYHFLDRLFTPLSYRPPHPQPFIVRALSFTPAPYLLPWCETLPTWTSPAPASLRRSSLRPMPRACVCRHFPCRFDPPFSYLGLQPSPCQPLGGLTVAGPSASLCPCLSLPESSSTSWHCPVLGFLLGVFSREVERPGRLPNKVTFDVSRYSTFFWQQFLYHIKIK